MDSLIFNPSEEYESRFKNLHLENTKNFFEELVRQSGVDEEQNRKTIEKYTESLANSKQLKKKLNLYRFLRVMMCILVVSIPLVVVKITPLIKGLRSDIENSDQNAQNLLNEAWEQMKPLNELFSDRDSLNIIEKTVPFISFDTCFSAKQDEDMRLNYDFTQEHASEESTIDVLAGHYNENPFLFENRMIHTMGTATYRGSLVIHWTETYYDEDGNLCTRRESETLTATVTKPKPFYHTQVVLNYCCQSGPELSFSRGATHLEAKSDKEIEKYVKRGTKELKKMSDKAIRENRQFTPLSNSDFEVMFHAYDRTNEVQFRSLFTPLAQTNTVALIRSKTGCGDDFAFLKHLRTNRIVSEHSQNRAVKLLANEYVSYSFDTIRDNFTIKNANFFRAVYFDFAPLWAIPVYQERPVHSLKPIPDLSQRYSLKEFEILANAADAHELIHPDTKTQAIFKSGYVGSNSDGDETCITAYSYDIVVRTDYVPVLGGDGNFHNVPVEWNEYIPLEAETHFLVAPEEKNLGLEKIASRNSLCFYKLN